jgi:hypothetical protein
MCVGCGVWGVGCGVWGLGCGVCGVCEREREYVDVFTTSIETCICMFVCIYLCKYIYVNVCLYI